PAPAATCITIANAASAVGSQAHIHSCDLQVGHLQVGMLLVNVDRSHVTDNLVAVGVRPPDDVLLQDADYLSMLRRQLISHIFIGDPKHPNPPANTNATVTFNNQ